MSGDDCYSPQDLELFDSAVRINTLVLGIVLGTACGLILWLSTYILIIRGGPSVGEHLSLLSVFFPGYDISVAGAWVGLFWGFLVGGAGGVLVYWTYARAIRTQLVECVLAPKAESNFLARATLLISGRDLGLAFGLLFGMQIFITTNWLVLRGTAENSQHAKLLANYLPGFEVSFIGSLIGALEIFVLVYIACRMLSVSYNAIARRRSR